MIREISVWRIPLSDEKDNHNPGAQNIEIIEWVQLKGNQNHFQKNGVWRSLVARSLWEREVQSSNLCTPIAEWRGLGNTLPS